MKERTLTSYIRTPGCYYCVVSSICTELCKNIYKRRLSKKDLVSIFESKNVTQEEIRNCILYLIRKRKYIDIICFLLDKLVTREFRYTAFSVIAASCNKDILRATVEKNNLDKEDIRAVLECSISYSTYQFLEDALKITKANLEEIDPESKLLEKAIKSLYPHKVRVLVRSMKESGATVNKNIAKALLAVIKKPFTLKCKQVLESALELNFPQDVRNSLLAEMSKNQIYKRS